MKILYFSATGNSLCIAKSFEDKFNAKLLSIPKLLKSNTYVIEDDVVGIVIPVYKLQIPNIVDTYLKQLVIKSKYTFVIVNHALFSFETYALISKYNFKVNHIRQMKMPNNFIPMFDMGKTYFNKDKFEKKVNSILYDVEHLIQRRKYNKLKFHFGNIIRSFNNYSYSNYDSKFYVNDNCTKCLICQKVCCKNNIEITQEVRFLHNCEYCLACIHHCPTKAIRHISEKSSARYINPLTNLNEIIEANKI